MQENLTFAILILYGAFLHLAENSYNISNFISNNKRVFIYSSQDACFTPVCTTEIIAFANANTYFKERNACLLGLSVDSNPSHLAWIYDIYLRTGAQIPFPIIADRNGSIDRKYGVISADISNTKTVRNVYIIDPEGIIRLILIYPMNIGRCIPKILRALEALLLFSLLLKHLMNCKKELKW